MNISAILGSPRKKGISSTIANKFIETAESLGATAQIHHLNSLNFKGCQGCNACKTTSQKCIITDDLTRVLENVRSADVLVLATPVYFWDVSGQFKCFFDRTWSLVKPDYQTNPDPLRMDKGKTALFITSQADVEEKHQDVSQKYSGFLQMYGAHVHTIRAFGCGMDLDADIHPFLEQAKGLAEKIVV